MKKIIALVLVIACMFTLACCGTENVSTEEDAIKVRVQEHKVEEIDQGSIKKVGSYYMYLTGSDTSYLSFLNQLDETKYQLVNISMSDDSVSSNYYYVTYKEIETE